MPKAKTLTVEAVAGLGAERLAALLLEAAEHDPALLRSLRLAVASRLDAAAVASETTNRSAASGAAPRSWTISS